MLIRSQDKKLLSQLSNIEIVERYKRTKDGEKVTTGYAVYLIGESNTELFIGEYSTEEKAIKVLDMIQDKYLTRMELDGGYDVTNGCYVQPNFWVLPKVFQMPQDREVEG